MAIEDAIRARLLAQSAVTAITSTVRPYKAPQSDRLPFIVFEVPTETPHNDLTYTGGLTDAIVRVMCCADTTASARALASAVVGSGGSGLAGYEGTSSGVEIQGVLLQSREAGFEPWNDASDDGFYHVSPIFLVQYTETP